MAKKSFVFPNYCDLNHWLKEYKPNKSDKIRLLQAGSISHVTDLLEIKPTLKKILLKNQDKVKFIYIGMGGIKSDNKMAEFIYGDDFWEGLPDNRESLLAVPGYVWPYKLASLGADLAVAPLQKNYFNRFKSCCKYIEYGINKIPAIYSGWHYKQVVKHGITGFLADTEEDWIRYAKILIENKKLRKEMGENAYNDIIQNYNINNYLGRYCDFIENL